MQDKQNSLDGAQRKTANSKMSYAEKMKRGKSVKKQIVRKKNTIVKRRSSMQAIAVTSPYPKIKKDKSKQKTLEINHVG